MKQTLKNLILTCFVIASVENASGQYSNQNEDRPHRPPPHLMDEKTKAAFEECHKISGMPERGSQTRPTEVQRSKFEACLKEKNLDLPERPHDGPPPEASFNGSSNKVYKKRSSTNQ